MEKQVMILFLLLSLSYFSFAVETPGTFYVKIIDANGRAVPNANVTYSYYISSPSVVQVAESAFSDAEGEVSASLSADVAYPFEVQVNARGASFSAQYRWFGEINEQIKLPLSDLSIRVVDPKSRALQYIPISISLLNLSSETNAEGYVFFPLVPEQGYSAKAEYAGITREISKQTFGNSTIIFPAYDLTVRTLGDSKKPLRADIEISISVLDYSERTIADENGEKSIIQVPPTSVNLRISYLSKTHIETLELTDDTVKEYLFDSSAPKISEPSYLREGVANAESTISVSVEDQGDSP
ncbi:MAG: Ig-like domain-containing protein, partial [Candidatus Micrarchaeota archaeon]